MFTGGIVELDSPVAAHTKDDERKTVDERLRLGGNSEFKGANH